MKRPRPCAGIVTAVWLAVVTALVVVSALALASVDVRAQPGPRPMIRERLQQRFLWEAAPLGQRPAPMAADDARAALNQTEALRKRSGPIGPPGRWQNIGPAPILGGQVGLRGHERQVNGRVAAVAVDPADMNHWLIGAASGGIWKTLDGGQHWRPVTDGNCSMAMGAIAFGPLRDGARVVYAGTGEAAGVTNAYGGQGLLVSLGGREWTSVREKDSIGDPCPSSLFAGLAFARLRVKRDDANRLAAAVRSSGNTPLPWTGIVDSKNGGRTWGRLLPCAHDAGEATALEINPDNFEQMYAGLMLTSLNKRDGVYRKMREGGCDAWERLGAAHGLPTDLTARIEMAAGPPRPCKGDRARSCTVLYVSIAARSGAYPEGLLGLWRTDDAWADRPTFKPVNFRVTDGGSGKWGYCGAHPSIGVQRFGDADFSGQCHYSHTLSVDPCHANRLFAGGIGLWRADNITLEGGEYQATWTEVSQITSPNPRVPRLRGRGIHVDQQAMAWACGRDGGCSARRCRLIVANDGGVWSTTDGGSTWANHNHGLSVVQFYGGTVSDKGSEVTILGGTQDNGTVRWTGSIWEFVKGGDAGRPVISSLQPATHWVLSYTSVLDGRTVQRTLDGGKEFARIDSPIQILGREDYFPGLPLAKCPSSDDLVLAGANRIYKTKSLFGTAAPTWVESGPNIRVTAFAFHPSCRTLAAAGPGGEVWVWNDGSPPPSAPNTLPAPLACPGLLAPRPLPLLRRDVAGLAFEPVPPFRLYAVLSGFSPGTEADPYSHIVRIDPCADNLTWEDMQSVANVPHKAIAMKPDPSDPGRVHVLVGTDVGVLWGRCLLEPNGPCTWERHGLERGLPNVVISDVQISGSGQIVAFTFGRGVFVFREGPGPCGGRYEEHVGTSFVNCFAVPAVR